VVAHYVLLFRGDDPLPEDLELIEQAPDVTILDHTAARALLVEAPEQAATRLRDQLQDWLVAEEVTHPPPGPARQSVREDRSQGPE
jgi:hypothetical protein